jgi:hypothetical protein
MSDNLTGRPPTTSLFAEALAQMTTLFETEIRLVRSEISEKITQAVMAVAALAVSAVLFVAALFLILQGIVELLIAWGMRPFLADFLVGVVIAVIGVVALFMAKNRLSPSNLAPSRSIHQLGKDAQVLKEQAK